MTKCESEDFVTIDNTKTDPEHDQILMYNYMNADCKGCLRKISFNDLCKAIAQNPEFCKAFMKQLVKDGAIPAQGD